MGILKSPCMFFYVNSHTTCRGEPCSLPLAFYAFGGRCGLGGAVSTELHPGRGSGRVCYGSRQGAAVMLTEGSLVLLTGVPPLSSRSASSPLLCDAERCPLYKAGRLSWPCWALRSKAHCDWSLGAQSILPQCPEAASAVQSSGVAVPVEFGQHPGVVCWRSPQLGGRCHPVWQP